MSGAAIEFEKSQKPEVRLATSPTPQSLKFQREDWSLFRTIEGLQQRAGVRKDRLRRLAFKELADNGLDNGADVSVGTIPGTGGWFVEDNGTGIDGTPEEVARLFSIGRPMISSKLWRLPTRGALGNGLRVVAGCVLASEGTLVVITRERRMELRPERDGSTTAVAVESIDFPIGTRIEISFGPAIPADPHTLLWAREAIEMARVGHTYAGKSSPWWYDVPQFHELLYASGSTPVRELITLFDGCTGAKAGKIVAAADLGRATCESVTREQAKRLLTAARENARRVKPERLGAMGAEAFEEVAYAVAFGVAELGSGTPLAEVPVLVEAWATTTSIGTTTVVAFVNRTPITGTVDVQRNKRAINAFGCGLAHKLAEASKDTHFAIRLNITTPYMPITSDGKAPDMRPFIGEIGMVVQKVVRKAHRPNAADSKKLTQKGVVLDNLDQAIEFVSGGKFRFGQRQLLYALRGTVMSLVGVVLQEGNFGTIITDYESENGEIPLMYREPRGTIYHPHLGQTITLGTLMVEKYERPEWTFNKLVYIEKEGFSEALKDMRWGERHDCAIMSSKGFSTRAARDLIDKFAAHNEPVTVFCVHDADASGTMIYQTLQDETKARGARKINIVNLGLEPWEAMEMGLEVETFERGEKHKAVADYVRDREDDTDWEEWLQTHRIELNAMTTPAFIEWLDGKMAGYSKLIPPPDVLEAELLESITTKARADITARILREAGLEDQITATVAAINPPTAAILQQGIDSLFQQEPDRQWRDHIESEAERIWRPTAPPAPATPE